MLIKYLLLSISASLIVAQKTRFDNHTLYNIVLKSTEDVKVLQKLREDVRFDFWNEPTSQTENVNILVKPEHKEFLEDFLSRQKIAKEILSSNIQEVLDEEVINVYIKEDLSSMQWTGYYDLRGIYDWLDDLIDTYPEVTEIMAGVSYEERPIKGIKISHGSGRRAIFLEGGMHSREWISPSTVNYIANELLTSDDEEIKAAARDFDWYIFPITNPDGYIWTHENFRMWRKNRRPINDPDNNYGVDLNRNWDNNWLEVGASTNPASDTYAGPAPFSERETISLSNYTGMMGDQIDLYLSFHSYGQMLLIPFGNSTGTYANYEDTVNIGRRAMGALSVRYNTPYRVGTIAEVIYLASGGSIDWVKESLNVPIVYCYELRDTSSFLLPANQILPNCEETMDSVMDIIHQGRRFGYFNSSAGVKSSIFVVLVAVFGKYFL